MFCVFLLMRLLSNGLTHFHQVFTKNVFAVLFVNGGTPMKIGPLKIIFGA